MSLLSFRNVIGQVPGEANVWGDLLRHWGAGSSLQAECASTRVARHSVIERVSPLEYQQFVWPTEAESHMLQRGARAGDRDQQGVQWTNKRQLYVTAEGRVWIPDDAAKIQQPLCVVAHAGASGHRGARATTPALAMVFFWKTMSVDVSAFVSGCLHCTTTAGGRIPRPFGETLRATKTNAILHFDYLTMVENESGLKYVLVPKDNMSGYVEVIACPNPTADNVFTGLMDWFKRFVVVIQWVSDQGAHLRNQVIEHLQRALGAQHHFTTAYITWTNGTVEVVSPELLRAVKALLSERQLTVRDWPAVLSVVQRASWTIVTHLSGVRVALDGLHAEMADASEKRRHAARERNARRQGVQLQKFNEGDLVLAATATGRSDHKLALVWRGPKKLVRALNNYTFKFQDIVALFEVSTRHASRLQLYRDSTRGREEELQEQTIFGEGGHLVEALRDCRLNLDTHRWETFVKSIGLDDIEAPWELAEVIRQDIPLLFDAFADAKAGGSLRRQTVSALNADRQRSTAPAVARHPRRRARAVRPTRDPNKPSRFGRGYDPYGSRRPDDPTRECNILSS